MTDQASRDHPGPRVLISAAEPSGDLHGAALIRATRAMCPGVRFVGVAGPAMREAGCEPFFDMTRHAAMLLGAVGAAGHALRMITTCDRHLRLYPFDAAVVIDSPTLHFPVAARAQAVGVPVLYYIAPQLWAWGAYRIYKLRHRCERVAVILPFEQEYFRNQGVDATYVGHPLVEKVARSNVDRAVVGRMRAAGTPLVALLPGSRRHLVETIFPDQLDIARRIAAEVPDATFGVSVANPQVKVVIRKALTGTNLRIRTHPEHHTELIQAADLVLVASGTASLEVALHGRPMIVMYRGSRLFYHLIARWMIHTPHLSLPNILAKREIVPEFMPYYTTTEPIAARAVELLRSEQAREVMAHDLKRMTESLGRESASRNTAAMLLDMIRASAH